MAIPAANQPFLSQHRAGVILRVHLQPRAKTSAIIGTHAERLKIRLAAPPIDGKANRELISFLANHLGISKNSIQITSGTSSRDKTLLLAGTTIADLAARLVLSSSAP